MRGRKKTTIWRHNGNSGGWMPSNCKMIRAEQRHSVCYTSVHAATRHNRKLSHSSQANWLSQILYVVQPVISNLTSATGNCSYLSPYLFQINLKFCKKLSVGCKINEGLSLINLWYLERGGISCEPSGTNYITFEGVEPSNSTLDLKATSQSSSPKDQADQTHYYT